MFDWSAFLDTARNLAAQGDEAGLRSAVSRSYYAAFCSARNHLNDRSDVPVTTSGSAHRVVWDEFEKVAGEEQRRIATLGVRLRRSRIRADYDDEVERLDDISKDGLADAEEILSLLARIQST